MRISEENNVSNKSGKEKIMSLLKNVKGIVIPIHALIVSFGFVLYFTLSAQPIFANNIQSSKPFTGTQKMVEDATSALLILIPLGVLAVVYFFLRRSASDEMDHRKWNKAITTAIISVIAGENVALILDMILKYYK